MDLRQRAFHLAQVGKELWAIAILVTHPVQSRIAIPVVGGDDDERFRPRALKLQANLQRLVESKQVVERTRRVAIVATMIDPSAFDLQNEMRVPPEPLQRRVCQLGQGWH